MCFVFVGSGPKKSDMFGDDGTKETLLPVMYDVHRRLHLMRATKAHVMRRGFGKHCRVISEVSTEQLLKAMASTATTLMCESCSETQTLTHR
jgi:hypothetical protein